MTTSGDALAAARRLLATVSPVALGPMTDDELGAHLVDIESVGKLIDALRVAAAAELGDRSRRSLGTEGLAYRNGCSRPEYLLERITGVSQAEASRRIRIGRDLRHSTALNGSPLPPRFPLVTAAVAQGEIGVDAALAITSNLMHAADRADLAQLAAAEAKLVDSARATSADLVAGQARVWRDGLDPDGAAPRAERIHERRRFTIGRENVDGLTPFAGLAEPVFAAMLRSAISERTAPTRQPRFLDPDDMVDEGTGPIDGRNREQRAYDVLQGLLTAGIKSDGAQRSPLHSVATVNVVVRANDLADETGPAWLDDVREPISAALAAQLACDGGVRFIGVGDNGEPLWLSRRKRLFTAAQRATLAVRDGGCVIPAAAHHRHGPRRITWCHGAKADSRTSTTESSSARSITICCIAVTIEYACATADQSYSVRAGSTPNRCGVPSAARAGRALPDPSGNQAGLPATYDESGRNPEAHPTMIAARLLDVLLILLLLVYLGEGWRNGFARSISTITGIIGGGIVAFFAIPFVAQVVPSPFWRTVVTIGLAIALLIGGHAIGNAIGRAIRGRVAETGLSGGDRFFGALANLVTSALVTALIAGSVGALGIPFLSTAISGSWVLRGIETVTPAPVDAALAQLRSIVLEEGLPTIGEALGGVTDSPGPPDVETGTDDLAAAAQSVVRISGNAYACGQNQSGTGFVVAADRIVTNAHVVAGVPEPVVEAPNGQALDGRVVYFDPGDDLAIVAVSGLDAAPLDLGGTLAVGDDAVIDGYPFGGPFTTGAAEVLAVSNEQIEDIYGTSSSSREVYSLAARINPGNSGGPLLTTGGDVAGVVFARSATDDDLGYAMTNAELEPVVAQAAALSTALEPGTCTRG